MMSAPSTSWGTTSGRLLQTQGEMPMVMKIHKVSNFKELDFKELDGI